MPGRGRALRLSGLAPARPAGSCRARAASTIWSPQPRCRAMPSSAAAPSTCRRCTCRMTDLIAGAAAHFGSEVGRRVSFAPDPVARSAVRRLSCADDLDRRRARLPPRRRCGSAGRAGARPGCRHGHEAPHDPNRPPRRHRPRRAAARPSCWPTACRRSSPAARCSPASRSTSCGTRRHRRQPIAADVRGADARPHRHRAAEERHGDPLRRPAAGGPGRAPSSTTTSRASCSRRSASPRTPSITSPAAIR